MRTYHVEILLMTIIVCLGTANATDFVSIPDFTLGNEPSTSPGPYNWALYFDVSLPIQITALGAFDSASDGIFISPIQVAIYDRSTGAMVSPVITFNSNNAGNLTNGFRYIDFSGGALILDAGFQGAVVAFGHSGIDSLYEPFFNTAHPYSGAAPGYDGGGLISTNGEFYYEPSASSLNLPFGSYGGMAAVPVAPVAGPSFRFSAYSTDTTIPEPTSLILLATGLGGIALTAWRRRK